MPIIERPLYGRMTIETTAFTSPFSWVDRTASLVGTMSYTEGGRQTMPGANTVDVGSLTATFKSLTTVPSVGDLVRLRRTGTSEYAFTGYVQDVSQRVVFENTVSLATPVVLTTIYCVDWVGIVAQWQVVGVGGRGLTGTLQTAGDYTEADRIRALNYNFDTSFQTELVKASAESGGVQYYINDTDYVGSIADHLDLMCRSTGAYWYGSHTLPTNPTTGRDQLIRWVGSGGTPTSSGETFTDLVGTAGQLHYTEIDFEASSQNVTNVVTLNNRNLVRIPDDDITILGGANESNFIYVDTSTKQPGINAETSWRYEDTTSSAIYGQRFSQLETNMSTPVASTTISTVPYYHVNLVANPSAEYTDTGFSGGNNVRVRRRQPALDANPFTAYNGTWAIRSRQTTAFATATIGYAGGESDGIPVTVGRFYRLAAQALRGTVSRGDVRAQVAIQWRDGDENIISTTTSANVTLTTANVWYEVSTFAVAPANAQRATLQVIYNRSGGGNHSVGDLLWADGLHFYRTNSTGTFTLAYLDGDSAIGTAAINVWTGEVGNSVSMTLVNNLQNRAASLTAAFGTTSMRATRIRWNAQEDLTAVSALCVGSSISLVYKGTTTTYRIIGIDGNVSPERYMIDYYLVKV